jgi:hypothetical protein
VVLENSTENRGLDVLSQSLMPFILSGCRPILRNMSMAKSGVAMVRVMSLFLTIMMGRSNSLGKSESGERGASDDGLRSEKVGDAGKTSSRATGGERKGPGVVVGLSVLWGGGRLSDHWRGRMFIMSGGIV